MISSSSGLGTSTPAKSAMVVFMLTEAWLQTSSLLTSVGKNGCTTSVPGESATDPGEELTEHEASGHEGVEALDVGRGPGSEL